MAKKKDSLDLGLKNIFSFENPISDPSLALLTRMQGLAGICDGGTDDGDGGCYDVERLRQASARSPEKDTATAGL